MPRFPLLVLPCVLLVALGLLGCGPANNTPLKPGNNKTEEHAHDHATVGPHGGHLVELAEPGKEIKEEYHVEWDHEENGIITVWILDGAAKKTVPIAADSIFIEVKSGEMTEAYELAAVDRTSGENASAFKFEVMSKALLGKLETVGKTVSATIRVDVNGKPYEGKFEKDEDGHAGHKH